MIEAETGESVELVDEIADAIRRDASNGRLPIERPRREIAALWFESQRRPGDGR